MTTINRAPFNALVDDDGSNTKGTIWNKARIQGVLLDPIDAALAALDAADVTNATAEFIDCSAGGTFALSAGYNVHILSANTGSNIAVTWTGGSGKVGERVLVFNRNVGVLRIAHNTNSIYNIVTSAPTPLGLYGYAQYVRYSGAWILSAHEQGGWITPPFSAANFSGASGMTWTVTAGQVQRLAYRLAGREMSVVFQIVACAIGGTVSPYLYLGNGAWGGFTVVAGGYDSLPSAYIADGTGNPVTALVYGAAGSTAIQIQKATGNFVAGGSCFVYSTARFEVS